MAIITTRVSHFGVKFYMLACLGCYEEQRLLMPLWNISDGLAQQYVAKTWGQFHKGNKQAFAERRNLVTNPATNAVCIRLLG